MGMTTTPKMRPICCGLTLVPMVRPSAPAVRLARTSTRMRKGQLLTWATTGVDGDVVGQREDDGGGDHALQGGEADLFDGDGGDRKRAHDAVVDLAGDAELLRERKGDGGDAGEHDGDGHEAGEQDGGEVDARCRPWPAVGFMAAPPLMWGMM